MRIIIRVFIFVNEVFHRARCDKTTHMRDDAWNPVSASVDFNKTRSDMTWQYNTNMETCKQNAVSSAAWYKVEVFFIAINLTVDAQFRTDSDKNNRAHNVFSL